METKEDKINNFKIKLMNIITKFKQEKKEVQTKLLFKMLNLIEENSNIVFGDKEFESFAGILKGKIIEFKKEEGLFQECQVFYDKYYGDQCNAFVGNNLRCENIMEHDKNHKNFCCEHQTFLSDITKNISENLCCDVALCCTSFLY